MDYYIKDLHEMKRHCSVVNVLSDDYGFAQRIIEQSGISNVNNLTESIFSGYYNSAANPSLERKDQATEDDIRAMINNYVLIASSGISGSCPSTNIVNCAHWSANFFLSPHLASVPIEKYLML
jgi:hypothetical protein